MLNGPPGGSGTNSGRVESWTTSCNSNLFDCENASFGSVPDCACPLTNSSERTQLRKSCRLFQKVKTTYGSPSLTGRRTWLEMNPGILSTRPARSRNLCSKASANSCMTRSEEHTSELQSLAYIVCRLLLEKKKKLIRCSIYPPKRKSASWILPTDPTQ